jgi:hypothetical protein
MGPPVTSSVEKKFIIDTLKGWQNRLAKGGDFKIVFDLRSAASAVRARSADAAVHIDKWVDNLVSPAHKKTPQQVAVDIADYVRWWERQP